MIANIGHGIKIKKNNTVWEKPLKEEDKVLQALFQDLKIVVSRQKLIK